MFSSYYNRIGMFWQGVIFMVLVSLTNSECCRNKCGDLDINVTFPFGIDEGCGDPLHRLECNNDDESLVVSSGSFSARVARIDYETQHLVIDTALAMLSLDNDCNLPLNRSAYPVADDVHIFCSPGVQILKQVYVGSCIFQKTGEELSYLGTGCYNFTRSGPREGRSASPPPSGGLLQFYIEIPWSVDSQRQHDCDGCQSSQGICGFNTSTYDFLCFNTTGASTTRRSSGRKRRGAIIGGVAAGVILLLACGTCCIFKRRRDLLQRNTQFLSASSKRLTPNRSLSSRGSSTNFSLRELQEATNYFSEDGRLGDGGFGTVYKGMLQDGRAVAVKKLNPWNAQGKVQFDNEVNILSQVKHPHLVQLYGCCLEGRELLLVYEFIANGTLADHIHDGRGEYLDWDKRLTIVTQTAEALLFLHKQMKPPIYHRDVKSTNILIDERFHAKVGDFGLSRLVPSLEMTHVTTAPQGTPGYLDPDYYQSYQLTDKSDVYSLGVVLMEIVSSQRAVDMSRDRKEINLAALALSRIQCGQLDKLIDAKLETDGDPVRCRMVERVAELAFACLAPEKDDRPCMLVVSHMLKEIQEEGRRMYLDEMVHMSGRNGGSFKKSERARGDTYSPTSIQLRWLSNSTSPNDSTSSMGSL